MDTQIENELATSKNAQEKLRTEREDRGAEQITPTSREELLQQTESVRRLIADTELRQQREKDARAESQAKDEEAVARSSLTFGELPSVVAKMHQEGATLEHLMELRDERDGGGLRKLLKAIETDLGSGISHEAAAPHSPEEEVLKTSKGFMPDLKQETAAKQERRSVDGPTESVVDPTFSKHRTALKQIFTKHEAKAIDALTPEEMGMVAPNIDRIKDAHALGLIPCFLSIRYLEPILKLSPEEFSTLQENSGTFSQQTLRELARNPGTLAALHPDDPRFPIAETLLNIDGIGAVEILRTKSCYKTILDQQDPQAYITQRLDLLERYKKLLPRKPGSLFAEFKRLDEDKVVQVEKLQDPEIASVFAETMMEWGESSQEFAKRIDLWQRILTPEILDQIKQQQKSSESFGLHKLVALRGSWTSALSEMVSVEEFREYLSNPDTVRSFIEAGRKAKILHTLDPNRVQEWDARIEVPIIEATPDPTGQQVKDILEMTGLTRILKKCVEEIEVVAPSDMGNAAGDYSGLEEKIRFTGQIDPERKKLLPGTVIHETGHAVENLLGSKNNGQAQFDSYAAGIVYRDLVGTSYYPEAVGKIEGREGYLFLRESFAEDFRVLLQNPELIPSQRRANMEKIFSIALPDIDIDELRGNIRRMYGALYGVSVNDVQRPAECGAVENFARRLDRVKSEEDRAKKARSQK